MDKKVKHNFIKGKDKKNQKTAEVYEGSISISSKGIGYFNIEETEKTLEIQNEFLNKAFPADTVEVKKRKELFYGREQGEVVKIIKRSKEEFVGTVKIENKNIFLVPDDSRIYVDFLIKQDSKYNLKSGLKVLVKILHWKNNEKNPTSEVLEVIGTKGENETEMKAVVLERGFRIDFPQEVENEAKRIKEFESQKENIEKEKTKRRDLRGATTFTIDPFDAKDFDDALSILKLEDDLYEIGIHIADVSHFVKDGGILDKEAKKRGTSVYLVDRTIPMLPEILSNDLCSLNPNEDKYTFSAIFKITKDGKIKDKWFGKTIIHSDKRFTYEEAQEILDKKTGLYFEELSLLRHIGKIFEKEKFEKGAINFETEEVKFELDKSGKPIRVYKKIRGDTHKMIEEFMLLANREVAQYIYNIQNIEINGKAKGHSVYRIHDVPERERIIDLAIFLKALGYNLEHKDGEITSKDISKLLKEVEGSPNEELIKVATIRSMAKAIYSTKNIGHFGLAFKYYTHFTSPIRRYPDLVVHRLLERELTRGKIKMDELVEYEKVCMNSSEQEKRATDAERSSIKYKQVEYMSSKIGNEFDGVITGVVEWGIYLEEKETKCEGMMKMKDLGNAFNDFFDFNPKTYSVTGQKTGRKFTLGDKVRFKVIQADIEKKLLDYKII
jgi:ribonuclease R